MKQGFVVPVQLVAQGGKPSPGVAEVAGCMTDLEDILDNLEDYKLAVAS